MAEEELLLYCLQVSSEIEASYIAIWTPLLKGIRSLTLEGQESLPLKESSTEE